MILSHFFPGLKICHFAILLRWALTLIHEFVLVHPSEFWDLKLFYRITHLSIDHNLAESSPQLLYSCSSQYSNVGDIWDVM